MNAEPGRLSDANDPRAKRTMSLKRKRRISPAVLGEEMLSRVGALRPELHELATPYLIACGISVDPGRLEDAETGLLVFCGFLGAFSSGISMTDALNAAAAALQQWANERWPSQEAAGHYNNAGSLVNLLTANEHSAPAPGQDMAAGHFFASCVDPATPPGTLGMRESSALYCWMLETAGQMKEWSGSFRMVKP